MSADVDRTILLGAHLKLRDEGEGWFQGVDGSVIGGRIETVLGPGRGGGRWYVVRLDSALEVQESGHATPSGFRLVRYERLLIRARHAGVDLVPHRAVTTYVCPVPEGVDPADHLHTIRSPDVWASCTLGA